MPSNQRRVFLSAVIPTLNEQDRLPDTIARAKAAGCDEVIVVDGGSHDETVRIASVAGADIVRETSAGRGGQLKRGSEAARGDLIMMLHADITLPETARSDILDAFDDQRVVATAFRVRFDSADRVLGISAWLSRFETTLTTFGDQAIVVRRDALTAIGGVPDEPLLEDVILLRRLRAIGRVAKLSTAVTASARRFEMTSPLRQQLTNAVILARFGLGAKPKVLARAYRSLKTDD
ncbi:MAG: TIGR04283 family arsenosugar biosynthesis glycosyltransferase [Pseudomonadota bacterium]